MYKGLNYVPMLVYVYQENKNIFNDGHALSVVSDSNVLLTSYIILV